MMKGYIYLIKTESFDLNKEHVVYSEDGVFPFDLTDDRSLSEILDGDHEVDSSMDPETNNLLKFIAKQMDMDGVQGIEERDYVSELTFCAQCGTRYFLNKEN